MLSYFIGFIMIKTQATKSISHHISHITYVHIAPINTRTYTIQHSTFGLLLLLLHNVRKSKKNELKMAKLRNSMHQFVEWKTMIVTVGWPIIRLIKLFHKIIEVSERFYKSSRSAALHQSNKPKIRFSTLQHFPNDFRSEDRIHSLSPSFGLWLSNFNIQQTLVNTS